MKRNHPIYLTLLFLFVTGQSLHAQNYQLLWDKTFGGDSRDWNSKIVKAADGSLFLIGDSQSDISGNKMVSLCNATNPNADIWILKIDTAGMVIWEKGLGGESDERLPQLLPLNNASKQLLLTCHSVSDVACDKSGPNRDTIPLLSSDYWVVLLDSSGNKIWDVTIGGENFDDFTQAGQLSSGDFLVSGESNSPVGYDKSVPNYTISNDLWTVRLDGSGNKIWDRVHGGDGAEYLTSVLMLPGDEAVLIGSTNSDVSGDVSQAGQGSYDYWMIKIDGSGNKVWDKRFGGSGGERCLNAIRTPDNGFLLCGYTVSPQGGDITEAPKGFQDIWIVKTDSVGNKEWDKRYGGSNGTIGTSVLNAPGGGYWIGGYTDSGNQFDISQPTYGGSDFLMLLTDNTGNKIWDRRFGGTGNDYSTSFALLNDSSLMVFGYADTGYSVVKTDTSHGWIDYWMVRFDYADTTTSGLTDPGTNFTDISIIPNPSNGNFILRMDRPEMGTITISISDVSGKRIYSEDITLTAGISEFPIDMRNVSKGLYFLTIQDDSGQTVSKMLILN